MSQRIADTDRARDPLDTRERLLLALLFGFTAAAVVGYGIFGLNPGRLPSSSWAVAIYRSSWTFFAQGQIVVAGFVLALILTGRVGARWLPALAAVYGLSFLSEYVGTGTGFPFSGYEYTSLLGPKLGGRVPWPIPLSWFLMAVPSYALARHAFPEPGRRMSRIVLASAWLVAWDLALDPAMSHLTPYWVWENPGAFYGMPWVNLAGWLGTGLVLMTALDLLGPERWLGSTPVSRMAAYYGAVLLMPLGMVTAAGLWGSVLATLGVAGACAGVSAWSRRRGSRTLPSPVPPGAGSSVRSASPSVS